MNKEKDTERNFDAMVKYFWSEKYNTIITRVLKLLCENPNCEKETMALYQLNCTQLCLKCFREWRTPNCD